ncbi:DNA/RNA non-specific endonuclease [Streptococcus agalactiae]|uniref:DNA/RNA non-specific endonuclease n=1 Tax=Streptococcus agalactiae TaxID=1311 RepID=UPI003C72F378
MKLSKQLYKSLPLLTVVLCVGALQQNVEAKAKHYKTTSHIETQYVSTSSTKILPFTHNKQIKVGPLDNLGRATYSHIQLRDADEPKIKRERLTYNPTGWHNYKFTTEKGKTTWLMDRGHLVGYQFSGMNNVPENLVTMTKYLNTGFSENNPDGMLYYENRLDSWLANHKNFWLDYKVTPIYEGNNLVPSRVELQYVGIDKQGKLLEIKLGGGKEQTDEYGVTTVTLENTSPLAKIDYKTGMLIKEDGKQAEEGEDSNSDADENEAAIEGASDIEENANTNTSESDTNNVAPKNRIVYVANKGRSNTYWYSLENIKNANTANIVQMTEQEALNQHKHHSTTEAQ